MRRRSVIQKAVEAQERAPVTAWILWGFALVALGYRLVQHDGSRPENWKHLAPDGVLLALAILAAPGFMKYAAGNAQRAIDVYRKFKGAKESKTEEESSTSGRDT